MDLIWMLPVAALMVGAVSVALLAARVRSEAAAVAVAAEAAIATMDGVAPELERVNAHLERLMSRRGVVWSVARRRRRRHVPSTM